MSDMEQTPPPEPAAAGGNTTPSPEPVPAGGTMPQSEPSTSGGNTGPLGKPRSVGLVIVLFIITLGIYGIYWIYKTMEEMKRHTGEGIGGILGLVIWIVIGIVMWFVTPSEVGKMYKRDGRDAPVTGLSGLWWLLPLIGAIVWIVKVQGNLNRYWESKGATA